jgi:hypothetical protein
MCGLRHTYAAQFAISPAWVALKKPARNQGVMFFRRTRNPSLDLEANCLASKPINL